MTDVSTPRWRWPHWLALLLGLAAAGTALWQLVDARRGLDIVTAVVDAIPVTRFAAAGEAGPRPVVVVAHGFAGSQQLMYPFAQTLAHNGFTALTFDFPGHGRNRTPLAGEIATPTRTGALLGTLARVVAHARTLPEFDGRLALLGHSMAGDITARYARIDDGVAALVAVSPYLSETMGSERPARVLFIYGSLEPAMIQQEGRVAIAPVAGVAPEAVVTDRTYGTPGGPDSRRLVIAPGAEHIGVLYSATSQVAAVEWLRGAFGLPVDAAPVIDERGPWLGLYFVGVMLIAWPLTRLLPVVVAGIPHGAGLRWRRLLVVAIFPAVLTPLLLMLMPTDFLALSIGDYIALHFALYGLLTWMGLRLLGGPRRPRGVVNRRAFVVAVLAVALFETLLLTLPTDRFIASFLPGPERLTALIALFLGALPWALADEWLTRGPTAPAGAYPLTKFLFLVSLMLAVALNLAELFFLVLVIPAILILFVVYGLFSRWVYRRTGHPGVAGVTNALAFAGAVAVTFPVLG